MNEKPAIAKTRTTLVSACARLAEIAETIPPAAWPDGDGQSGIHAANVRGIATLLAPEARRELVLAWNLRIRAEADLRRATLEEHLTAEKPRPDPGNFLLFMNDVSRLLFILGVPLTGHFVGGWLGVSGGIIMSIIAIREFASIDERRRRGKAEYAEKMRRIHDTCLAVLGWQLAPDERHFYRDMAPWLYSTGAGDEAADEAREFR